MGGKRSDLRRRAAIRDPVPRFTIFCEGRNTEPTYLRALRHRLPKVLLRLEPGAGVPYTLAQKAVERAREDRRRVDSYEKRDEIWAVFDRDEHPRYEEAADLCRRHNIGVARSNPCFELWLILHLSDYDRSDDRHQLQRHLRTLRPAYDPDGAKTLDCNELLDTLDKAETRAETQLARRAEEGVPHGPPSTTMGALIRAWRKAAGDG